MNVKRSILVGAVLGAVLLLMTISVPRLVYAPPLIKMGVVNWEQTVVQYQEFQNELNQLHRKRRRIMAFIEDESSRSGAGESGNSRNQSGDEEIRAIYQDTLKQIDQRRKTLIETYHRKINQAIREEAIEQGFSLILSENEVLYASEEYTDLTHSVIERLNQK